MSQDPGPAPDPDQLLAEAADHRARLDGLVHRVDELTAAVEKLVADAAVAGPALTAEPTPQSAPAHPSLGDFVGDYLLPMFTRPTLGGRWLWCPHWWEHSEAVSRLTALWHAWEALRDQPGTALGSWYREHLDHHLPILMGPDGPFRDCANGHYTPDPVSAAPYPPADSPVWEVAGSTPAHTGAADQFESSRLVAAPTAQ